MISALSLAEVESRKDFEHYSVHYSVFSSTSISPEIAALHNIKRGKDVALINITVIDNSSEEKTFGQIAKVSGTAANLMQQQKQLDFIEIKEPGTVYYIATLRHINEEVMHFEIEAQPKNVQEPFRFKFTKTLYVNP